MMIVFIHGIGNKPAPATLKRQWDQALFQIDMGSRSRLAYWADLRYPQPLPSGDVEGLAISSPEAFHPLSQPDRPAFGEYAQRLAPYGAAAQTWAQRVARTLLAPPEAAGAVQRKDVAAKVLPGFLRRPVVEWITKAFIEDTAAYFFDPLQRDEMRQRLRQILLSLPGPFVVIAHSQGSIIAYDVLRELDQAPAAFEVPLFVTIGSPLGLAEVQDHVIKPLRVPRVVGAWANFADVFDPVAGDKKLAGEFTGSVRIEDVIVVNRDSLRLTGFNPHSGTGYLATQAVRSAVREVTGSTFASPIAPFVIARDVASDMADPTQRINVLIELRDTADGQTLDQLRQGLEQELRTMEQEFKAALPANRRGVDYYEIDGLQRFVSANLMPTEIDVLAGRHQELQFTNVWRNSRKRALLDRSAAVVQALTAHAGYGALGQGIHWAVLDTGVAPAHPHFRPERTIAAQVDCTQPGAPRRQPLTDADGHGTHVAGIIAGRSGRDDGPRGLAPKAKLHVYKVLDDSGNGRDSWIIKALDDIARVNESARDLVIHGVNLSLGGPFDEAVFACGFSPICRELRRLWRQGVVVCIAAGNEGHLVIATADGEQKLNVDLSIGDPANLDEAIAVGSVHRESPHLYGISWFSSRGPTADGRSKPDVVAPGEKIRSCNAGFEPGVPTSEYVPMSGTSMACPHVSGIVAAFLSVRREFIGRPDLVKQLLLDHCTDLKRDRYHQGAGLPNLTKMLLNT
ncbi:MAG: S8 family peptidase [Candidatus Rokuibacteriota bacterium]